MQHGLQARQPKTKDVRSPDDAELLARAAGGEESALAELYRRHVDLCRKRALAVLFDRALADDAVQEAFVDLWQTAGRFDESRATVRSWLCILVHRRAVDICRREARRRATTESASFGAFEGESCATEELLLLTLDRRRVQRALTQLERGKRQVVELAYYGGLSHSQIARRLGVPLGTVKSRMHIAHAHLAVLLDRS